MRRSILVCAILMFSASGHGECPTADLTGDCYVNLADLAVIAGNWIAQTDMGSLLNLAEQWLTGIRGPQGMVFVTIPGGTFQMGDSFGEGYSQELPVHTVTLGRFKMSKYEVTNAQYTEYLNAANALGLLKVSGGIVYAASDGANIRQYFYTHSYDSPSQIDYAGGTFTVRSKLERDMSNDPVVEVSWYGAKAFCDYYGYRLPTEAEWEYAARGGLSGKRFPWGDTISHTQANYRSYGSYSYDVSPTSGYHPTWGDGVYPYTSPVGSFAANGYGLHDMSGTVWDWCNDWYDSGYYNSGPQQNPQGPVYGVSRVLRGSGWNTRTFYCRTAIRSSYAPTTCLSYYGFRPSLNFP